MHLKRCIGDDVIPVSPETFLLVRQDNLIIRQYSGRVAFKIRKQRTNRWVTEHGAEFP